jgi:hypothetical protein
VGKNSGQDVMEKTSVIRRRHIFYVEGYDPQGADGYYGMFRSAVKRYLRLWPVKADVSPLAIDSDLFAHWTVDAAGPNWQVATQYAFLRQEEMIRANMAESMLSQLPRALGWIFGDLSSGTMLRILRYCWRFGAHLVYFQVLLLIWIALALTGGWFAGAAVADIAEAPGVLALLVGIGVAAGLFALLRYPFDRWHVVQINNHWPLLRRFARGEPSCFDRPIDACVDRLIAAARTNKADEIVVIGHSGGCVLAPTIVARALQRDPDLGRHGPAVILMTLGSIMPAVAMPPDASAMRETIRRLAIERSVVWIDAQSRKDIMNFWDFDPVTDVGIDAGPERCNPVIWQVRFKDMVSPEFYKRLRTNFFRLHYQFILGGDRRAAYDYLMLTCGPKPVVEWARSPQGTLASFAEDGSLAPSDATAAPASTS